MKGRLKQLTGVLLAVLLCFALVTPASAASPSVTDIATAALDLISSHEGTYNSVNANDSGAVSVGKIQWHGERAHEVVRLAAQYMGPSGAIAILGQSFYDEIMSSVRWDNRSVNSVEAEALRQLLGSEAGHRAEDEIGARDLSAYVNDGMKRGLSNPTTLVYYCDLMNQWPVQAWNIARDTVAKYGGAATVDKIHEIACASPMAGCDHEGPLAVFRSAMKIPQEEFQAMLLNMKFSPSVLKTDADKMKLAAAIKAYFSQGGKHVQFIVENQETLKDAKAHPEKHSDLMVRVAGYSTYFVQLTPGLQDEVIERTSNTKI